MPTLALSTLRSSVAFAADVTISAAGRYPTSMVNEFINSAIRSYVLKKTEWKAGDHMRSLLSTSASTATGSTGFPANETVALPANFLGLVSAFLVQGAARVPLEQFAETDRDDWALQTAGLPQSYSLTQLNDGTAALRLWPPSNSVYDIEVVYHQAPAELVTDGDAWAYEYGTEDAVICQAAMRILERDGVPEVSAYQALQSRRDTAFEELRKSCQGRDNFGVRAMRDTRSLDRFLTRQRWFR